MATETFAAAVHRVLISEKRFSVRTVAEGIRIRPEALYNRLYERTPFQVEEVRRLLAAAPSPDLATCLLEFSPFFPAERANSPAADGEAIHQGATRTVLEAADVLRAVQDALIDGRIDHRERPIILKQIEEAERAIASLKRIASGE
jgi:hypothetical protein